MQTDPIADFLTRLRNANMVYKESVEVPASRIKEAIASILVQEGYIEGYRVKVKGGKKFLELYLKYSPDKKERVIRHLERVSKPGRRVYVRKDEIPTVLSGLGICILSTPKGILTGAQAKKLGVGGEVLCYIW
ncbi:30S ribosomal protein S8 [Candidatus Aerophobetes bacterium]|nr:30S ribosomal protein S8 [Candidatus Aerophobetes bacterium]